ncbi:MAG: STAS/SEC14 domain-containing protein [bacterium]|nr:STAS/SEC14 domain-containing protein [bacterium]
MDLERIASVGNGHWEEWATKMGAHLTKAAARYFDTSEKETVRQWLHEG